MALIRKVVEIETNENSTRFGSGFYIECQILGKVSKSELVDLKLFRIPGDESGTTRIVRYVHEDICVRAPKIWKTINSTDIPMSRMDMIL